MTENLMELVREIDKLMRRVDRLSAIETVRLTGGVDINLNNGQLFVQGSNGYTGIANTSPARLLHVGSGTDTPSTTDDGIYVAINGQAAVIVRDNSNNVETNLRATTFGLVGTRSNHNFAIRSNNSTRIMVLSTGEIGIGTDSPSTRLDIDAGAMELAEMTAPGGGAANTVRLYADDNGAGKTRLMAVFNTGAAQQVAIEP